MKRALLITSHKNNTRALEHLFESLDACSRIGDIDVIAVIGGYEKYYTVEKRGAYTLLKAPHNSIDFTGLLAMLDTQYGCVYDSYFYIHDTTRAGPRFIQCILDLPPSLDSASFAFPSMNIGLYSRTVLEESKDLLETFRNTDVVNESLAQQFKKKCVEMEDCIFKKQQAHTHHFFLSTGPPQLDGEPRAYYGSDVMRHVEYYPEMDLYKIKANWYVKPSYQLSL